MRYEPITFRVDPDAEPVQRPEPRVVVVNGTRYTLHSPAPVPAEAATDATEDEQHWPADWFPGTD